MSPPCLKCHPPILANATLPSLYPRDRFCRVQGGSLVFVQTCTQIRSSPKLLRLCLSCFGHLLSDFRQPHEKPQNHPFCDFVPNCALILVIVVTCFQGKERDFNLNFLGPFIMTDVPGSTGTQERLTVSAAQAFSHLRASAHVTRLPLVLCSFPHCFFAIYPGVPPPGSPL